MPYAIWRTKQIQKFKFNNPKRLLSAFRAFENFDFDII